MFISNEVAQKRLDSSANLLHKIDKRGPRVSSVEPAPEPPDVIDPGYLPPEDFLEVEDSTCESAQSAGMAPSPREIQALLNAHRKRLSNRLSTDVQASIAILGSLTTRADAARAFGVHPTTSEDLNKGFTSDNARYGYDGKGIRQNLALVEKINQQKEAVRDLAFEKLTKSLKQMSDEMLQTMTDPVKVAKVARDLSQVVEKVIPKEQVSEQNVHFHVWRPEMAIEADYEVVNVSGHN